jgi:hypothetical protein
MVCIGVLQGELSKANGYVLEAQGAFHCARLANFLLRPTLDTIQTLLVLGHVLQNNGQADASWALLGTTIRLAQCLGLHEDRSSALSGKQVEERRETWFVVNCLTHRPTVLTRTRSALLWQDSLLSLSFDRPPARCHLNERDIHPQLSDLTSLGYIECMHHYCDIGRQLLKRPRTERARIDIMWMHLQHADEVSSKSAPHLQSLVDCSSRQSRIEHHVFRLQASSCASFICRPALLFQPSRGEEAEYRSLLIRAKHDLLETIHAFLDLQTLTVLPLRTWSMIHASISAALLLQLMEDSRPSEQVRKLQNALVDAISRDCGSHNLSSPAPDQSWLSTSHLRALRTLRAVLSREETNRQSSTEPVIETTNIGPTAQLYEHLDPSGTYIPIQVDNMFRDAEMAELSLDTFGNIQWGKSSLYENIQRIATNRRLQDAI